MADFINLASNGINSSVSVDIAVGETSLPVLIKRGTANVSIAIHPNLVGSGKAQITLSPIEKIKAGEANWFDWVSGDVAVSTMDVAVGPITAVRGVNASGTIILEVASDS